MPRNLRCIAPGLPYHITQRGVDRRETISSDVDRTTYLKLLFYLLPEAGVRLLGWCLMPNHVHLIAVPNQEDSLAVLFRRLHGRYAQYYNAVEGRMGHLWQSRYFACILGPGHLVCALRYVDLNPVRANLLGSAEGYRWSSAEAHVRGADDAGLLDMDGWRALGLGDSWKVELQESGAHLEEYRELRRCTHAGRPFGDSLFVQKMEMQFGRNWHQGRPPRVAKKATPG